MSCRNAIESVIGSGVEAFESQKKKTIPGFTLPKSWIKFVTFVIILLAVVFFGKFLWNEIIAGAGSGKGFVTILKPVPTIWHAIALFIAMDIFFGNA
tara:strand:- start:194 stop:484 length:291 start_codon:yes stop_codon:yes gene_type:complete